MWFHFALVAIVWIDPCSGLLLALAGTLAALLLLAWRINRSDRATGLIAQLASLSPLGRWRGRQPNAAPERFPEPWAEILRRNVRLYGLLPPVERERLHDLIRRFLHDRTWEGCRGQSIDDEVRVTIAGQACMLLLGRPEDDFDNVPSILVYPSGFETDHRAILEERVAALGQAVYRGPVILAWDEVIADGRYPQAGHNVVFHEFAHQLDFAGDATTTDEAELARRRRRHDVLAAEYERLVNEVRHGHATLLDPYGATSPAEFFAVATECFFTRPIELRMRRADLYGVLHVFYGQDTAGRFDLEKD